MRFSRREKSNYCVVDFDIGDAPVLNLLLVVVVVLMTWQP
ncbi:hypothetical protein JOE65_001137 [Arthrobacter roseus]|nr:hypothetical protein [Arthrobacter roseus]